MTDAEADPDDEKGGSQVIPDKPDRSGAPPGDDHEQDREGEREPSADKEHPDSF